MDKEKKKMILMINKKNIQNDRLFILQMTGMPFIKIYL